MQFLLLCVEISSRAATTNQSVSILVQSLHAFLPKLFFMSSVLAQKRQ